MDMLIISAVVVIALIVLFSMGASPSAPAPMPAPAPPVIDMLTAERAVLLAKLDLDLQATELRLRQGGSVQAAEGAAIVRARAMEFVKGYK